jgi:hypothetical protein
MSALGQKRTFAVQLGMSALSPKGDMCGAVRDVRYGPIRPAWRGVRILRDPFVLEISSTLLATAS